MSTNPLQQYFRRPALYLKLPSQGEGYPENSIEFPENGELAIFPMTAIDEITARTPDALFNGVAVIEIIKSCVPSIKDPWKILQIDLDPILLAIKMATNGSTMEFDTVCPSCEEPNKYDINLTQLLNEYKPGEYNTPLKLDQLSLKFCPLNYKQINETSVIQFEIQRALRIIQDMPDGDERNAKSTEILKKMNQVTMDIIVETIEYISSPNGIVLDKNFIKEFLENVDVKTFEKIKDISLELKKSTDTKPLKFKCINCNHEYEQPFTLNTSDFFA
jgi:hypothetical protein